MKRLALVVAAIATATFGCASKQAAVNNANTAIQLTVDACQEAPALLPPGAGTDVIALVCAVVGSNEQTIEVIVDSLIWNAAKLDYLAKHGALPRGMTPPKK